MRRAVPAFLSGLPVAILLAFLLPHPLGAAAGSQRVYLILPFEDSAPEPDREWLREAMAISLGEHFLGAGLAIVSREDRLTGMDERDLPGGAPLTLATSILLGRHLRSETGLIRPDRLVVGKLTLDQGMIFLSARVIDLASDRAGTWLQQEGSLKDLLSLQRNLAEAILSKEGIPSASSGSASDDATAGDQFPLVAYESRIRALIAPEARDQIALLRTALEQAPTYPKAAFQLARLLHRAGKVREAEEVLRKMAGEPNPYGPEYHELLGEIALDAGRLPQAEEEARRSLAARERVEGRILLARILRARGDLAAARRELDRAARLDPENPELEPLRKLMGGEAPAPSQ